MTTVSFQSRIAKVRGASPLLRRGRLAALQAIVLGGLCAPTGSLSANENTTEGALVEAEVILHGNLDTDAERIEFYWESRNWPGWLGGFRIKAQPTEGGPWIPLHPDPIVPSFSAERDWSNQGLNEAAVAELMEVRDIRYGGNIPERSPEEVLYLLNKANGLKSGDRLAQKLDYNIALYSGFAFVHHLEQAAAEEALAHQYGLFPVDVHDKDADAPIDLWSPVAFAADSGTPENLRSVVENDLVVLRWEYDAEQARERSLFGFRVMRKDAATGTWLPLIETPLGSRKEVDGLQQYEFTDPTANATEDQVYAVVAVDMFQESFGRLEVALDAERFLPLAAPTIVSHGIVGDADVKLDWDFPAEGMKRLSGFFVERQEKGEYERISPQLGPETRSFADREPKEYGEYYQYRIVAVDQWEKTWPGRAIPLLYLGQAKPRPPQALTGEFLVRKGQPGILLRWEGPTIRTRRTAFHRVISDEIQPGKLLIQGGIEPLQGNRFFYPLGITGGRTVEIGLLPVTPEGIVGDSATVRVAVPPLRLPPVTGTQAVFNETEYAIELSWSYPEDTAGLTGFAIKMDDEFLPAELQITPDSRSLTITDADFEKGQVRRFEVIAQGGIAATDPGLPATVRIPVSRPPEGVDAPSSLSVELVSEDPDQLVAHLAWQLPEDMEAAGLNGYALLVDYAQEGNVRRLNSLPPLPGPEFTYRLPGIDGRKTFTFRLAPITEDNQLGPYAEAVLELPAEELPTEAEPNHPAS